MDVKTLEFLINNALGAMGLALLAFLANSWIKALEGRFDQAYITIENRIKNIDEKQALLEDRYKNVLDLMLEKFSAWEDRISNILSKIRDMTPEQLKLEIDKIRNETKSDIENMKFQFHKINVELKEEKPKLSDNFKVELLNRIDNAEKRINMTIKMIAHLNSKSKEYDFKINNLTTTRRG